MPLTSGFSIRMVCQQTAIPEYEYSNMESGAIIDEQEAELLGTLLGVEPYYLKDYSMQLQFINAAQLMLNAKNKKIRQLANALKRKIKTTNKRLSKPCTTNLNS
ncbi:hypothetical protein FRZ67_17295 [Panacibacter ginsenosidivorans]|uniref:Uncharacterized protein n=1 Tax=Panacibacter ginsenosidivorans TaxID=1813871 RepID=A0A5B8VF69_9BACT|nr:hypothetical protein [Panacibacter ginsenosidivorans]QEC68978.1 hypothetical protein FRZ67_17295 [Panacibacter ginsenosidivorans]